MRLAVDTGGTFTDVVLADDHGQLHIEKALTTHRRPFVGIQEALSRHAARREQSVEDLLRAVDLLIYGTTAATNAIVTRSAARTALLTTEGFADTLSLREGGKQNAFEFTRAYAAPYVPRRLTFEVRERVGAEGTVVIPLDEDHVRALAGELRERQVQAVAVCLLWSIAQPGHEQRVGELLAEELPNVPVTLSHQLNPVLREYRRSSGAAIDASLKPLMDNHFTALWTDLETAGFAGDVLAVTCMGGAQLLDEIRRRPIYAVNSGPAMAPIGARLYVRPGASALVADVGGTTFDVSLVRNGEPARTRDTWLGEPYEGDLTGLASVDVRSVGAGGGSIASVDAGGLLRVGPRSAGSDPGPACYGRGGQHPTVSDAALVLGYLDPNYFLGGELRLDVEAARRAIEAHVSSPLGLDVERAAYSIFTLANVQMSSLLRDFVLHHGLDPRTTTLVAGGGAGGMLAADLAGALGCREVIVPRTASALSATGGAFTDIVREFSVSRYFHSERFDISEANAVMRELAADGDRFAGEMRRHSADIWKQFLVEARHPSQSSEIEVAVPVAEFHDSADVVALTNAFEIEHERLFGVRQAGHPVECISWKLRCGAVLTPPDVPGFSPATAAAGEATAPAYFRDQMVPARQLRPDHLSAGQQIDGPAIVHEATTALVVPPGWRLQVLESAAYRLSRREES